MCILQSEFRGRVKFEALGTVPNRHNLRYLETKKLKQGHSTVMATFNPFSRTSSVTNANTNTNAVGSTSNSNNSFPGAKVNADRKSVYIISTSWNEELLEPLVSECKDYLNDHNFSVKMIKVPGYMELATGARLALKRKPGAIICMGVVLVEPGSMTAPAQCQALMTELHNVSTSALESGIALVQGVSLCSAEHAAQRSKEDGKAGKAYAMSAIKMLELFTEHNDV